MAGAASFTHVHDWTMRNAPPGTGSWFGWANAIISELTPTAAGIEIRRRKRQHRTAAYPMAVLIAAAAALPGRPGRPGPAQHHRLAPRRRPRPRLPGPDQTHLLPHPRPPPATTPARHPAEHRHHAWHRYGQPGHNHRHGHRAPEPGHADDTPASPLLLSARMAAFAHHRATGQAITPEALASHLNIPHTLAGTLLHHIGGTPPPVTAINGTPLPGDRP